MNIDRGLTDSLKRWKGAGTEAEKNAYAQSIMKEAGLSEMKVGDMDEAQFNKLIATQLRHESGALYGWMNENGYVNNEGIADSFWNQETPTEKTETQTETENFSPDRIPQYQSYLNSGSLPAGLKPGT